MRIGNSTCTRQSEIGAIRAATAKRPPPADAAKPGPFVNSATRPCGPVRRPPPTARGGSIAQEHREFLPDDRAGRISSEPGNSNKRPDR